jgi:integrase
VALLVDPPKVPRAEARALAPDEVQRLLAAAWGEWRVLWLVGLYTGLRVGELLGLPWAAVTWDVGDGSGEGVHPHLLRHTFASALLLAGRPVTEVAYLLGHATAATTLSVYAHWVRRGAGDAAAALSRAYQDSGPSPNSGADANTGSAGPDR